MEEAEKVEVTGEAPTLEVEGEEDGATETAMPLTMAASVILTALPKDASSALQGAGDLQQAKVTVRLQPVGSAPVLRQRVFRVGATQPFSMIESFLRKKLGVVASQGIYCYVNNVFAPAGDEVMGNLWRCFKSGDELIVAYATMPAFG